MLVINKAATAKLDRVGDERCSATEGQREEPAETGADRDHRAPRRANQRGGDRKVFGVDQIGQRGLRCRTEERTEDTDARLRDEDQEHRPFERIRGRSMPPRSARSTPRSSRKRRSKRSATGPANGRQEERGQRLRDEHQRREQVGVGAITHEAEDRDGREPVAAVGDQLCEEERAKVAIATEELQH